MGPRRRCTRLFDEPRVPRAARAPVLHAADRSARRTSTSAASRSTRGRARARGGGRRGSTAHATGDGKRSGRAGFRGTWSARHAATCEGVAIAAARRRRPPTSTSAKVTPEDDGGAGRLARRPRRSPRCGHDDRRDRCARWSGPAAGPLGRASTSDTALAGLPRPPRRAQLRPGRPRHCATCTASCKRGGAGHRERRRRPADPRRRRGGGRRDARADASHAGGPARLARPRREALDDDLAERRGHAPCSPTSSCPCSGCSSRPRGRPAWPSTSSDAAGPRSPSSGPGCRRSADSRRTHVIGKEINLGSPKQLQVVLFDELQMPKTKRTKTGYTTDADALQTLNESRRRTPSSSTLLEPTATCHAAAAVTVKGLLESALRRRPHPHHVQPDSSRRTGRLSSTEPNLQNIPVRTEAGRRIRDSPSWWAPGSVDGPYAELMTADYSADRDADHGAPLGGQAELIESFRSRGRTSTRSRRPEGLRGVRGRR